MIDFRMKLKLLVILIALIGLSESYVEFTYSTLYDIYDFMEQDEVIIPRCSTGCLMYTSTVGPKFNGTLDNLDPFALNLIISDGYTQISIAEASRMYNIVTGKPGHLYDQSPTVKVTNKNPEEERSDFYASSIVLYVFDINIPTSATLFDALTMQWTSGAPEGIFTIMSALPFTVTIDPEDANSVNSVNVRLVGFDSAVDNNPDGCPIAFKTPFSATDGLTLQIASPIVSLVFDKQTKMRISTVQEFSHDRKISESGFIASPGWNGCTKMPNKANRIFRSPSYFNGDVYTFNSLTRDEFKVDLEFELHNDDFHSVLVTDMTNGQANTPYYGMDVHKEQHIAKTSFITVENPEMTSVNQGFIMRYTSTAPATTTKSTTTPRTTTQTTRTTVGKKDTTTSSTLTSTTTSPALPDAKSTTSDAIPITTSASSTLNGIVMAVVAAIAPIVM